MTRIESIEHEVQQLSTGELADFRRWFTEFDAQAWDQQFEDDVRAGKLDRLADEALRAHAAGQTTRL